MKRNNLFIHKKVKNDETLPDAVAASSVMFFPYGNPWSITDMKMWQHKINTISYYIWTLGAATILDYCIAVDVLGIW